jgi:hypothetical protein
MKVAKYGLRKTIQFSSYMWEEIRRIAYELNVTPSEVIRMGVEHLREYNKEDTNNE